MSMYIMCTCLKSLQFPIGFRGSLALCQTDGCILPLDVRNITSLPILDPLKEIYR